MVEQKWTINLSEEGVLFLPKIQRPNPRFDANTYYLVLGAICRSRRLRVEREDNDTHEREEPAQRVPSKLHALVGSSFLLEKLPTCYAKSIISPCKRPH